MSSPGMAEVTRLLHAWKDGDRAALELLIPIVYHELRALASRQLAREWRRDRLETTAVVNEAYFKLFGQRDVDWQNRGHFFAVAAQLMRRILVDYARQRGRKKRGAGTMAIAVDESIAVAPSPLDVVDTLDLDRALQKLEQIDPDAARLVELRFFGGLTIDETASALGVSTATLKREWVVARGWLHRELTGAARSEDRSA